MKKSKPKLRMNIGHTFSMTRESDNSVIKAKVIGIEWGWWRDDWVYFVIIDDNSLSLMFSQTELDEGIKIWSNGITTRIVKSNAKQTTHK